MNSVTLVLMLVIVVFSLIAVEIFGLTRLGQATDVHANFRSFSAAYLTFFRMITYVAMFLEDYLYFYPDNRFTHFLQRRRLEYDHARNDAGGSVVRDQQPSLPTQ